MQLNLTRSRRSSRSTAPSTRRKWISTQSDPLALVPYARYSPSSEKAYPVDGAKHIAVAISVEFPVLNFGQRHCVTVYSPGGINKMYMDTTGRAKDARTQAMTKRDKTHLLAPRCRRRRTCLDPGTQWAPHPGSPARTSRSGSGVLCCRSGST